MSNHYNKPRTAKCKTARHKAKRADNARFYRKNPNAGLHQYNLECVLLYGI